tara:strand:+ start:2950 stop:5301 length:2352 start_codon:yes stop_codon:yes gene_type:complete
MSEDYTEFEDNNSNHNRTVKIGEHFNSIKSSIPASSQDRLEEETFKIFDRINFDKETGLVVGYIQSGKTLSFEALTALGRDNDVGVTIILAGISTILTDQTFKRIKKDFKPEENLSWVLENTQKIGGRTVGLSEGFVDITKNTLNSLHNPNSLTKKGILIVSMKNYRHINSIAEKLGDPSLEALMKKTNVLIIDDEADQYSLNTNSKKNSDEFSSTYKSILKLREACPRHAYIQYTGTPTGIMLESTFNQLSPDFAENINPGENYVGIESLFWNDRKSDDNESVSNNSPYINVIDDQEVGEDGEDIIPEDLQNALAVYIVGGIDGYVKLRRDKDDKQPKCRSMLVHPSHLTSKQFGYYTEVQKLRESWQDVIKEEDDSEAKKKLLERLKKAHGNLKTTCKDLLGFDDIVKYFDDFMSQVMVSLINSTKSATQSGEIPWDQAYGHILVSGNAVDRGTTVEGLTVTYMPRSDSKQIDTQMQRARFLGYKEYYKELIRIYCTAETIEFFDYYFITQNDFRSLVTENEGKNFREAHRYWRIQSGKNSCRQVINRIKNSQIVTTGKNKGNWSFPRRPHLSEAKDENNRAISQFIDDHKFENLTEEYFKGSGDYKVNYKLDHLKDYEDLHHQIATIDFSDVYKNLVSHLKFTHIKDMTSMHSIMETLRYLFHYGDEEDVAVFNISHKGKNRERSYNDDEAMSGFHRGALPDGRGEVPKGAYYSGDRMIFDPLKISIQIHKLDIKPNIKKLVKGDIYKNTYTIALRLPNRILENYNLQVGGGINDEEVKN